MEQKPLFIPLKTEYYEAFINGSKVWEYRLYGKRWNENTCKTDRPVIISKGYGKQNRRTGYIRFFTKDSYDKITDSLKVDMVKCYGEKAKDMYLAAIRIELTGN